MIAHEHVGLIIDRPGALANAQNVEQRGGLMIGFSIFGLLFGALCGLWAIISLILGDRPIAGAVLSLLIGTAPTVAALLLMQRGLLNRWKAETYRLTVALCDAQGAVSIGVMRPWIAGRPVEDAATLVTSVAISQTIAPLTAPRPTHALDPRRLIAAKSKLRWSAVLAGGIATVLLLFGFLWMLVGVAALFKGEVAPALVIFILGVFPLGIGGAVVARVVNVEGRRDRLMRFVFAILAGAQSAPEVAARMGVAPHIARETALLALRDQVVSHDLMGRFGYVHVTTLAPGPIATLPLSAWPGRTLKGTWFVEACIGSGGMGVVYRVRNLQTGRSHALKAVLPENGLSEDVLRRFQHEALALRSLTHPSIVALHDFDRTEEGALYLVMDLLEGESLESRLQRDGRVPPANAVEIAGQIGSALAAAHTAGLLHRDVKPSNVFLQSRGGRLHATLIDFGLVKRMGPPQTTRMTSRGQAVGTPLYMSPEQARGEQVDARSDLYGLAVVLYEMLAGVPPFFDPNVAVVYAKLLSGVVPTLPNDDARFVQNPFDPLLGRALAARPDDRFADLPTFLQELSKVARSLEAETRVASAS